METLEGRLLMSAGDPAQLVGGVLRVHGTEAADVIRISDTHQGALVSLNGQTQQFYGSVGSVEAFGYQGNDEIRYWGAVGLTAYGGKGDDLIVGGEGNDKLYGEGGRDRLYGHDGNDTIEGGTEMFGIFQAGSVPSKSWFVQQGYGGDFLDGGKGDDVLRGGDELVKTWRRYYLARLGRYVYGYQFVYEGIPGDTIHGGDGEDEMDGGAGDDALHGQAGRDTIDGGFGHDVIHGGDECLGTFSDAGLGIIGLRLTGVHGDTIDGGDGNDVIYGGNEHVKVYRRIYSPQAGYVYTWQFVYERVPGDVIDGGKGNDLIWGGGADDWAAGGDGDDRIFGDDGADTLDGDAGNDRLYGGGGNDLVDGGDGHDLLWGGDGADRLYGAMGNDSLWGGPGSDDTLSGGPGNDYIRGGDGNDAIHGHDGGDRLYGDGGNDTIKCDAGYDQAWGGAGNDVIDCGDGADWAYGEAGNDTIRGGAGNDTIQGGTGRDRLYGEDGDDKLWGGPDNDRLAGGAGSDWLYGEGGMDALFAWEGSDSAISGGDGSDRIYVSTSSQAWLFSFGEDAGFHVDNSAQRWTQDELDVVDAAVGDMHEANGTDTTIQKAGGRYVTFVRRREHPDGRRGQNDNGTITIYDSATVGDAVLKMTVVHELGHNWDTENPYWATFLTLSGWTRVRPVVSGWTQTRAYGETWWYYSGAVFYDDECQDPPYGSTNPMEDWATCVEAYFYDRQWMQENMPSKYALVDNFLRNYEGG